MPERRACLLARVTVSVTEASLVSVVAGSSAVKLTSVPLTTKPRWIVQCFLWWVAPLCLPWFAWCACDTAGTAASASTASSSTVDRSFLITKFLPEDWVLLVRTPTRREGWEVSGRGFVRRRPPGQLAGDH